MTYALTAIAFSPEKELSLDIAFSRQTLFIHVKNTFDGIVNYNSEKRIASRKTGGDHGQGLKNIRRAAEKYNGHIDITHDAGTFSVTIVLYVNAQPQRPAERLRESELP